MKKNIKNEPEKGYCPNCDKEVEVDYIGEDPVCPECEALTE